MASFSLDEIDPSQLLSASQSGASAFIQSAAAPTAPQVWAVPGDPGQFSATAPTAPAIPAAAGPSPSSPAGAPAAAGMPQVSPAAGPLASGAPAAADPVARASAILQSYQMAIDTSTKAISEGMPYSDWYLKNVVAPQSPGYVEYAQKIVDQDQAMHQMVQQAAQQGLWQTDPAAFERMVTAAADARGQLASFVADNAPKGRALYEQQVHNQHVDLDNAISRGMEQNQKLAGPVEQAGNFMLPKHVENIHTAINAVHKDPSVENKQKLITALDTANTTLSKNYVSQQINQGNPSNDPAVFEAAVQAAMPDAQAAGAGSAALSAGMRAQSSIMNYPARIVRAAAGEQPGDRARSDLYDAAYMEAVRRLNPKATAAGHVVGRVLSPESVATIAAGGAGADPEAVGLEALLQRGAAGGGLSAGQSAIEDLSQGRAPNPISVATAGAAGMIAPNIGHAASEAFSPAVSDALANAPSAVRKAGVVAAGMANTGAANVATNMAIAGATGQQYTTEQLITDPIIGAAMHLAAGGTRADLARDAAGPQNGGGVDGWVGRIREMQKTPGGQGAMDAWRDHFNDLLSKAQTPHDQAMVKMYAAQKLSEILVHNEAQDQYQAEKPYVVRGVNVTDSPAGAGATVAPGAVDVPQEPSHANEQEDAAQEGRTGRQRLLTAAPAPQTETGAAPVGPGTPPPVPSPAQQVPVRKAKPGEWTVERMQQELLDAYHAQNGNPAEQIENLKNRVANDETGLHPDDLEGMSTSEKAIFRPFVNEQGWSNKPLSRADIDAVLSHNSRDRQLSTAIDWAHNHADPALRFVAWMHDTRTGAKKGTIDISTPEKQDAMLGRSWKINGHPFRLTMDEDGTPHLVDDGVEFPAADQISGGKIPYDAGTLHDDMQTDFAPAEPQGSGNLHEFTTRLQDLVPGMTEDDARNINSLAGHTDVGEEPGSGTPLVNGGQSGLFGPASNGGITGSRSGDLPFTEPSAVEKAGNEVGQAKKDNETTDMFPGGGRSGGLGGEIPTSSAPATPHAALADDLAARIGKGEKITSMALVQAANKHFGGTVGDGKYTVKDAYDALELAVNKHLAANPNQFSPTVDLSKAEETARALTTLTDSLPTQTRRTGEQMAFQQFSTPPAYAFAANWIANVKPRDVVLEPSAGVGGIAVFAKNAGAEVHTNELAPRRADLLRSLGFSHVTTENAEQIANTLTVRPTVVVMNPPFSQTAGRMGDKKVLGVASSHIEQAFKLLPKGGRLVAIVGEGMKPGAPRYAAFFRAMAPYLAANVGVSGDVYKKYGTTFGTRVLVFDKTAAARTPVTGDVPDVLQLMKTLEGVRDARITPGKPTADQSGLPAETAGSRPVQRPGPVEAVPAANGGVGAGAAGAAPNGRKPAAPAGVAGGGPLVAAGGEGDAAGRPAGGPRGGPGGGSDEKGPAGGGKGTADDAGGGNEPGLKLEEPTPSAPEPTKELSESVFENYRPQKVRIAGAVAHPTPLVESAAMASVSPPAPTYLPKINPEVIKSGGLSDAQLENIVYAGQAHEQMLPDGTRRGYFIGDGTGVGKGRTIAGIFQDNWARGRHKGVWVSENFRLLADAKRDWTGVGGDGAKLFGQDKIKLGEKIAQPEGLLFTGYGTLRKDFEGPKSRVKQLVDWLGKDFDGVIAFDESHNMKNALPGEGARGPTQVSETALAALELQKQLPNARVVYVSATGATEVSNLAYAQRLGLWGEGTAFPDAKDFINKVKAGGVAAMELVARDMKQMGAYLSRGLSFDGVKYDRLEHALTGDQIQTYDKLAEAWQHVLRNIDAALQIVAGKPNGSVDGKAKSAAYSAFWGTHQRFFNQIMTAMQMPTVLKDIQKQLDANKSVVIQLTNTNEAAMERSLAKLQNEEDSLENLDMTPRDSLMQMVEHSFPVNQMEEYRDENGNVRMRPSLDSKGNPVVNREAVAMREKLLSELGSIRVPDGPLEILMNHFGVDAVAENTGRNRRVVYVTKDGKTQKVVQPRSKGAVFDDVSAFNKGKKRVLVFSQAGGTGASYHADKGFVNQQQRVHYLLQAGWIADKAVQGLGRSHRSNQATTPFYQLVTTDLPGQKRFVSSIARRMDQLGAITKGQRQAASAGIFKETDNLESQYAKDALTGFFKELHAGGVPGLSVNEFQQMTGLRLLDDEGNLLKELPPITQFLNRMLSLPTSAQHDVFNHFSSIFERIVRTAKENGTFDAGVETVRAHKITKNGEQVVFTDKRSGAQTKMLDLTLTHKTNPLQFEQIGTSRTYHRPLDMMVVNKRSGGVYALVKGGTKTLPNGRVTDVYHKFSPSGRSETVANDDIDTNRFDHITDPAERRRLWDAAVAKIPPTEDHPLHMITGAVLPIWDRLGGQPKVYRLQTSAGERVLGRVVPEDEVPATLKNLGVGSGVPTWTPEQALARVIDQGTRLRLANGWEIRRSKVMGEQRAEIIGPDYRDATILKRHGVVEERIDFKTRYFVPTDTPATMAKILSYHPIADVGDGRSPAFSIDQPQRSREGLEAMTFAELRQLAREMGVAAGSKPSLVSGILDKQSSSPPPVGGIMNPADEGAADEKAQEGPTASGGHRGAGRPGGATADVGRERDAAQSAEGKILEAFPQYAALEHHAPSRPAHLVGETTLQQVLGDAAAVRPFTAKLNPGQHNDVISEIVDPDFPLDIHLNDAVPDSLVEPKLLHGAVHSLQFRDHPLYQEMAAVLRDPATTVEDFLHLAPSYRADAQDRLVGEVLAHAVEFMHRNKPVPWLTFKELQALQPLYDRLLAGEGATNDADAGGDGSPSLSRRNAPTFYSHAERVVADKMQGKAAPLQVRGMLLNNGVKPDEMKWSGIDEWLKAQKGPVTKEQVLEQLRQNNVQIQEVVKGEKTPAREDATKLSLEADALRDRLHDALEADGISPRQAGRLVARLENHESLGVLPEAHRDLGQLYLDADRRATEALRMMGKPSDTRYHNYQLPGGADYRELLLTLPAMGTRNVGGKIGPDAGPFAGVEAAPNDVGRFQSSHWNEPNILAHVRFNTRHDADGNRVLLLEEVQSDWHQQGRERGYQGDAEKAALAKAQEEYEAAKRNYNEESRESENELERQIYVLRDEKQSLANRVYDGNGRRRAEISTDERDAALNRIAGIERSIHVIQRQVVAAQARERMQAAGREVDRLSTSVPDAPFKKNWHELALRRMVRWAAENGYDKLAWTTGAQQAERYDLSKHIKELAYEAIDDPPGTYEIIARDHTGATVINEDEIPLSRVEALVGKELAKKIESGEGEKTGGDYRNWRKLSGLDLKVGGEGMKGFYDKIIPDYLTKYAKKWNAKVGETPILTANLDGEMVNRDTVHTLDITDEMRRSVLEDGQPLYSLNIPEMLARAAQTVAAPFNFLAGEMASPLMKHASGRAIVRGLDFMENRTARLVGQVANAAHDAFAGLTHGDRQWLDEHDAHGYSNYQKMREDVPTGRIAAPNARVGAIDAATQKMMDLTGDEAERVQLPRADGSPFKKAKSGRFLRLFTPMAMEAIHEGSGPLFEALADTIARENPGIPRKKAAELLDAIRSPDPIKHNAALEQTREIKNLPTYVEVKGSGWMPVLETDPLAAIIGAGAAMGRRIYFYEALGSDADVARLRMRFRQAGGSPRAFDDIVSVANRRPWRRVPGDPRALSRRLLKATDQAVSIAQTSLSVIPNLPQPMMQVPRYTGPMHFLKGLERSLSNPKATAAELAALGAVQRSAVDWAVREGRRIEDAGRVMRDVAGRVTGTHYIAQFNNIVTGAAFRELADHWRNVGFSDGDMGIAKDLLLTPREVAAVRAGKMTDDIYAKIIQNGVKKTQFVTEDPHRRSAFQNTPLLGSLFAYNNYMIGTFKASLRMARDVQEAVASKNPKRMAAAGKRLLYLLAGSLGAGLASVLLSRGVRGKPLLEEGDGAGGLILDAMYNVQLLGPVQRAMDAATYGGGYSMERTLIALSPKIKLISDLLGALTGIGGKKDSTLAQRMGKVAEAHTPAVKAAETWYGEATGAPPADGKGRGRERPRRDDRAR